jgi:hypothetical protein
MDCEIACGLSNLKVCRFLSLKIPSLDCDARGDEHASHTESGEIIGYACRMAAPAVQISQLQQSIAHHNRRPIAVEKRLSLPLPNGPLQSRSQEFGTAG